MHSIGSGVREIRIHTGQSFRVIYVANFGDTVYVLHAFQKKTQKTARRDVEIARQRFHAISDRHRS